jgi:ATP-dependent Clp protease ATP-binding subunit ClpB
LADQHITLTATDAAKAVLAREGYDPVFGARPLKRTIQKLILDTLSLEILSGKVKDGDQVKVDVDKKNATALTFQRG